MEFIIGADPEVFVGEGKAVRSIIGKIGGTKENPLPLPLGEGFAVQEDNVALEFNIPASKNKAEFVRNIGDATAFLEQVMRDRYGFNFINSSAESFPDTELTHPAAHIFGCEPDYNAWTNKVNPRPKADDKNLRSCGGHVHIGVKGMDLVKVIRAMDLFLGVPSVRMDKGEKRRNLYGGAGAFRKKAYGGEYRTLSNFWIFSPELTEWVYDNTERALVAVKAGMDIDSERKEILNAINKNSHKSADYLIETYNLDVR